MVKRAPNWQEMMRLNLELKLVSATSPTRVRNIPGFFTSGTSESSWLGRTAQGPVMTAGRKARTH